MVIRCIRVYHVDDTTPLLETEAKLLTTSGMSECRPPLSAPRQPLPAVQAPKPSTWCCFSVRRSPSDQPCRTAAWQRKSGSGCRCLPTATTPCFGNEERAVNARGVFTKPKLPANWCRLKNITRGDKNRQNKKKNAEPRGPRTASLQTLSSPTVFFFVNFSPPGDFESAHIYSKRGAAFGNAEQRFNYRGP